MALLKALDAKHISSASETTREEYKNLIQQSMAWWQLLRMFKMSVLPGLKLTVPKVFAESPEDRTQTLLDAIRQKRLGELPGQASTSGLPQQQGACSAQQEHGLRGRSVSLEVEQPKTPSGEYAPICRLKLIPSTSSIDNVYTRAALIAPSVNKRLPGTSGSQKRKSPGEQSNDRALRRPRGDVPDTASHEQPDKVPEDEYVISRPTTPAELSPRELRVHHTVKQQLLGLSQQVQCLAPSEARAFQSLLAGLTNLQGTTHAARVLDALAEKIPVRAPAPSQSYS